MFTGIIEAVGRVKSVELGDSLKIEILTPFRDVKLGESIAIDGACLTVIKKTQLGKKCVLNFEVAEETLRRTAIRSLKLGTRVNLERSLTLNARLSGHFVLGHVDGTSVIKKIVSQGTSRLYWFSLNSNLAPFFTSKGSVAINGISLTIVDINKQDFSVIVLPYTIAHTSLGTKTSGDVVNIETDILAKIIVRQTQWERRPL